MGSYKLELKSSIQKDIRGIPKNTVEKLIDAIEQLATDPLPTGVVKLEGATKTFRVRVGDYRIIYEIDQKRKIVNVLYIRNRREAYKKR